MADKRSKLAAAVKNKMDQRKSKPKTDLIGRKKFAPSKDKAKGAQNRGEEADEYVEDELDDFDSEMADPDEGPIIEEETTDEKRIRLAKQVINEAKMLRKREELNRDDVDEDEAITGILQNGIVGGT
jgi:hypothetical protein